MYVPLVIVSVAVDIMVIFFTTCFSHSVDVSGPLFPSDISSGRSSELPQNREASDVSKANYAHSD